MGKRELIELVLIDLMGKMEASIYEMIATSKNRGMTKNFQESIIEIHRLALAHRQANESLCELLAVVCKYSVPYIKNGNNIDIILNKIATLNEDIRSVGYVEKFYETLADLELSIHTLEAIGEIKIAKVVSEAPN